MPCATRRPCTRSCAIPWSTPSCPGSRRRPSPRPRRCRTRYIGGPGVHYAVCLRGEDAPIGYVSLAEGPAYDLGYGLARAHWGQGIPSEAAAAVLAEARRAGLAFVTATHDVHNPASGGVMRKIGMTYRYSYVERWMPKDQIVTFRLWQIDFAPEVPTYREYWNTYPDHFVEEL